MRKIHFLIVFNVAIGFTSCKSSSFKLFKPSSPHEEYIRKLETSGLDKSSMGAAWIRLASESMENALNINTPYKETGFFDGGKVSVVTYIFSAIEGQKITINLTKKPNKAAIYVDLWNFIDVSKPVTVAFADTLNNPIQYEIESTGNYLIRLQPELLQSAEYTLQITSDASLAFPTKTKSKNVGSFWGDGRDNNARKHEGVDIFGSFRSPVLAAAEGTITRVNQNNLGGKVVWLRPKGKKYTLYYAHLSEQIAVEGQLVNVGDTVGLMGNSGNAKNTPTHLHFGIYTSNGAVDPLPFINPTTESAIKIRGDVSNLNKTFRTISKTNLYSAPKNNAKVATSLYSGTVVHINSATGNFYKVELPNGSAGFVKSDMLINTSKPIQKLKINVIQENLYSQPDSLAPVKLNLTIGQTVNVLGNFNEFLLINDRQSNVGWIVK